MQNQEIFTTLNELIEYSAKLHNSFDFKLCSEEHDLFRKIFSYEANRPGMQLFGFFENFAFERLQIVGRGEFALIKKLEKEGNLNNIKRIFDFEIPAVIFCNDEQPSKDFLKMTEAKKIPVVSTPLNSERVIKLLYDFFNQFLSPREIVSACLMDIHGLGVLIRGEIGDKKSECILELIKKSHRFVTDDVVDIRKISNNNLLGKGSQIINHHIKLSGIGIINMAHLFGVGKIRDSIQIDMVIDLEYGQSNKKYDTTGMVTKYVEILEVKIPHLTIPLQADSNIAVLLEVAAMNERLKKYGYNSAQEFNKKISSLADKGSEL